MKVDQEVAKLLELNALEAILHVHLAVYEKKHHLAE